MRVRIRKIFDIYIYECLYVYILFRTIRVFPPFVVPCSRNELLGFGYVNILNWCFEFGLPQKINCARHHFLLGFKAAELCVAPNEEKEENGGTTFHFIVDVHKQMVC